MERSRGNSCVEQIGGQPAKVLHPTVIYIPLHKRSWIRPQCSIATPNIRRWRTLMCWRMPHSAPALGLTAFRPPKPYVITGK